MLPGPITGPHEPAGARATPLREEGAYLTDGRHLFRVVWPIRSLEWPDVAILEDCRTLDLVVLVADELCSRQLTPVIITRVADSG